jgi:hypothetical protein
MSEDGGPTMIIGVTELPANLPEGAAVLRRDCGCYLIMQPGDPDVSEFTCAHGYFVGRRST